MEINLNPIEQITLMVPGPPKSKLRPKVGVFHGKGRARGIAYDPKANRDNENWIGSYAMEHAPSVIHDGPVIINIFYYLPLPESKPNWWKDAITDNMIFPTTKPDLDNLTKMVLDTLGKCNYWHDDKQVIEAHTYKRYGKPHTQIVIIYYDRINMKKEYKKVKDRMIRS